MDHERSSLCPVWMVAVPYADCPEGHKLYRFAQQTNVSVEQEADDGQGAVDGA